MGLFDKKTCDICGASIGLLGNRKLEDGNCCKECVRKLSPFFSDRRRSTIADIKRQLTYREMNRTALNSFAPGKKIDTAGLDIYVDQTAGKFIVTRSSDWKSANPDLLSLSQVYGVDVNVTEDSDEIMDEDKDGNEVSFNPPRFEYEYTFEAVLHIKDCEWFDTITIEVSNPSERPDSPYCEAYQACTEVCKDIRCTLMPGTYNPANAGAFTSVECSFPMQQPVYQQPYVQQPVYQQPYVQQPVYQQPYVQQPVYQQPYVQQPVQQGYVQQPAQTAGSWYCPNCGSLVNGNFCTNCGTGRPQ